MIPLFASPAWRLSDDIAVVDSDDRVVVLNLADLASAPVVLEGSAARIWRLVDDCDSEAGIVEAVARAYDVQPTEVRAHVHAFLRHLHDLGLITRSGERS